ncbi:hypothetical protein FACS189473_2260 [Spirochaetia bacterium]|nr:hypothetical protein FACS189473_2260 [Spirochaetia bacterium]
MGGVQFPGIVKIPNILICGQTGTGKSSVINFIFKQEVAEVGRTAEPKTRDITLYKSNTINIYDSEGYEIGSKKQRNYEHILFDEFLHKYKKTQDDRVVHMVWYTISGANKRYTDLDLKLIRRITLEGFSVCVLLTKIDELDNDKLQNLLSALRKEKELIGINIFKVSENTSNNSELSALCDWEKLTDWSYSVLPDIYRKLFVASLRMSSAQTRKLARAAIAKVLQ